MADGKYSLDDILNEYSADGGSGNDIDIDDIIGSYDKPAEKDDTAEKVTLHEAAGKILSENKRRF